MDRGKNKEIYTLAPGPPTELKLIPLVEINLSGMYTARPTKHSKDKNFDLWPDVLNLIVSKCYNDLRPSL